MFLKMLKACLLTTVALLHLFPLPSSSSECICTASCPATDVTMIPDQRGMPGKRGEKGAVGSKGQPGEYHTDAAKVAELEVLVGSLRQNLSTLATTLIGAGRRGRYEIRLTTAKLSFQDARLDCVRMGGDLLQRCLRRYIDGDTYASQVEAVFRSQTGPKWVGLSDRDEEGRWTYLDGSLFYGHRAAGRDDILYYWAPGQPQSSEDCGGVRDDNPIKLHDFSCSDRFHGICEISLF